MPQISKIRIVNFQYNEGKRLIADELFDFEGEGSEPSNVLINLTNGGGKSVLVQLAMQPIIPKAKVAGRRIESFFTKTSDHCFVAIEWVLDGSKMRLMTGIAMAASDSSRDSDNDRGFQIKYYTFISTYQDQRCRYNIVDLPLSRKEEGKFVPAAFDEIRNLARKSEGELIRFNSEDSVGWQEKLSQYGIFQSEWRMIEELNSNEDGLSKYFSNLKTSDVVIDKLIIPRIEEKQHHQESKDDSSLETMLISYAKQFSRQKDSLKEQKAYYEFLDMLKKTKPDAEALWNSNDSLEKLIEKLFAFSDALNEEKKSKETQKESLEDQKKELNEKLRHIDWEKASADFYSCEEEKNRETARLKEAESTKSAAQGKRDEAKKKIRLIECARYYEQWKKRDNEINAISIEIKNKENNTQSAKDLASLKYSAFVAISSKLDQIKPEIERLLKEKEIIDEVVKKLENEISNLDKKIKEENDEKVRTKSLWENKQKENDENLHRLGIRAERMLDGKYQESDLNEWKTSTQAQEQSLREMIEKTKEKIEKLESRRDSLPREIAASEGYLEKLSNDLEDHKKKFTEFDEDKKHVQGVFQKHSLSEDLLFTNHGINFINERLSGNAAEIKQEEFRIEVTEDQIDAVKRGTLHIPKIISNFLDRTGLRYRTVENYILNQQANKSLSLEEGQKLLEKYPFMAYGIIADAKDVDTIKEEARDKWFPSILPIFTPSDVEQLITGEATPFSAISAYSKKYFLNHDGFSEELNRDLNNYKNHKDNLEKVKRDLNDDLELLKKFTIYNSESERQFKSEIEKAEASIKQEKGHIASLKTELEEVRSDIKNLRENEDKQKHQQIEIQGKLSKFDDLIIKLGEESKYENEYDTHSRLFQQFTHDRKEKEENKAERENQRNEKNDRLEKLNDLNRKLDEGLAKVSDATEAEVIDNKEWSDLLEQYNKLLEQQNTDLKNLNDKMNLLINDRNEKQEEIKRRDCKREEYENLIYSESREEEARKTEKECETEFKKAESAYNEINGIKIRAESDYENAVKGLDDFNGEPLPKNEVGSSFESRILEINQELKKRDEEIKSIGNTISKLEKTTYKAELAIEQYARPTKYDRIVLDDNYDAQLESLKKQISENESSIKLSKKQVEDTLNSMASKLGNEYISINQATNNMKELLDNTSLRGDKYYTLVEHINANIHTTELSISKIETDLKELKETKGDLIRQCVIQGKQMYEGLQQISNNSKVKVQDRRRQMIKFDIPDAVDENIAKASIAAEIEKGAEEIASKFAEDSYLDSEVRKIAIRIVGSKSLLRKYIGAENIVLKAYKIDRNPENSGYRTWEQTQVNNSGAEKFVVYFAVILALMAYAREEQGDFDGKNNRSVLILDNPFGPISSKHVLEPMFEIAKNYKVQMICLSEISKSDIISCFNLVIRAIVKQFTFSNKEQLTHEGNESIEHGFYRSEQMSLW